MARRKTRKSQLITIDQITPKGVSGLDKSGNRWTAKGAALQDTVTVQTGRKGRGTLLDIVNPSPKRIDALCPHFLTCGGCQLQHTPLQDQRQAKEDMIRRLFQGYTGNIHPILGGQNGYHYRNKMELSFGCKKFYKDPNDIPVKTEELSESYLGMHPWQWYSKIVPLSQCSLAHPHIDAAIQILSKLDLAPAWNTHTHVGAFRHVVLREGNGLSVTFITSSEATRDMVMNACQALQILPFLRGVIWKINDGVAEVATGELKEILFGKDTLEFNLLGKMIEIPHDGFSQVNDEGANILYQCILDNCHDPSKSKSGTLLDLYCGSGSIGIALSDHFDKIIGIEIQPQAIEQAKANAQRNHVQGEWLAGKVEELLPNLPNIKDATILLDPPREGLHPKVGQFFSKQEGKSLIYVACNPKSLARDREILENGNWKMTDLWMVDMFAQTPHIECVGLFSFNPTAS